ncbi:hypothetical protein [Brevundimonas abyssalis]|uniref:Uncharacterized protein n=1 Tax=Brevundimonas abyssalis TAR-001 TaxID=1391729 RepID=A0A8E0TSD6_9CAUL|nr:hypothetical protein [Brevundimonas abyssalis]GAD60190.1 hypothetical protein MBEBAB_2440 [Brevundimonas abyssalis TAR-001]
MQRESHGLVGERLFGAGGDGLERDDETGEILDGQGIGGRIGGGLGRGSSSAGGSS